MAEMNNIDIKDFTSVSSVIGSDNIVISLFGGQSGKITVALFKSIITKGITPSIDKDGYWLIGETNTNVSAEGKTPEFRKGTDGIDFKYTTDDDTEWKLLIHYEDLRMRFEDLTSEQIDAIRLKYDDLTDEQIAELQKPATDIVKVLNETNTAIELAENLRKKAEEDRVASEDNRIKSESEREQSEEARVEAEIQRTQAETTRNETFKTNVLESQKATQEANEASIYATEQGDYAKQQGDFAEQYVTEIGDYKARIEDLEARQVACTQEEYERMLANGEIKDEVYYNIFED